MQMIYLLHSPLDEELVRRIRLKLASAFGGPQSEGSHKPVNDNADAFEGTVTDDELIADLHFGRVA